MTLTRALVAVNILIYIAEMMTGGDSDGRLIRDYALVPLAVTTYGEWWRLFSAAFLHGSIPHVALNMLALYQVGGVVENSLGRFRFGILYLCGIIGSSILVVVFADPRSWTVGASGAIFALFGALVAIGLQLPYGGMDLVRSVSGIIAVNLIFTFLAPGISWQAHIGGLLTGFVVGLVLFAIPSQRKTNIIARMRREAADREPVPVAAGALDLAHDPQAIETIEQPPESGPGTREPGGRA